jgi:hypothetical protein
MRINYVLCTYGGIYSRKFKNDLKNDMIHFLKYNLKMLDNIETNITTITIMKPKINPEHILISDYYNFEKLNLINIKDKIRIIECENIGISYGQFLACVYKDFQEQNLYDYYIFNEDDYIPALNFFERHFLQNYDNDVNNYLCLGINNKDINNKLIWNYKGEKFMVPDFSIGIINNKSLMNILKTFSLKQIQEEFLNIKHLEIHHNQIVFGYILYISDIKIYDLTQKYLSLFFENMDKNLYYVNFIMSNRKYDRINQGEKFHLPLFLPIDIFYPNDYNIQLNFVEKYLENSNIFREIIKNFNDIKITTLR